MSKSKNPDAFPYTYYLTFKAVVEGKEIKINFDSKKEAEAVRFDMYGYRNALEHIQDPFYAKAAGIKAVVRINIAKGYDLILTSVIDDPINVRLLEALAREDLSDGFTGEYTESTPGQPMPSKIYNVSGAEPETPPSVASNLDCETESETDTNEQECYKTMPWLTKEEEKEKR